MKRWMFASAVVLVACLVGSSVCRAQIQAIWDAGGGDTDWHNADNWEPNVVPVDNTASAWLMHADLPSPEISGAASPAYVVVGAATDLGTCALEVVDGADLQVANNHYFFGNGATGVGYVNVSGGNMTTTGAGQVVIGQNGSAYMTVSGGYVEGNVVQLGQNSGSYGELTISGGLVKSRYWAAVGHNGGGVLTMTGGEFQCGDGQRLIVAVPWASPASGHIQLDGGLLNVDQLELGDIGTMDITGGTLLVRGDLEISPDMATVMGEGRLTAYGGRSTLVTTTVPEGTEITAEYLDPCKAWAPNPLDNATLPAAERDAATVYWKKGDYAVSHDVYFSDDLDAITAADNSDVTGVFRRNQLDDPNNSYDVPETLALGETYYWRIDEVSASGVIVTGNIWTLTVQNYLVLEDFESYTSSSNLRGTWSGSPRLDTDNPNNGLKAMKATFNTTGGGVHELSRSFSGASSDWTTAGVEALALFFRGDDNVLPASMYVTLSDGTNSATVNYDGDMDDLLQYPWQSGWTMWNLAMADFAPVNPANVVQMTIGFGAGGSGSVYFDDIRLYAPRCVSALIPGDIAGGDCVATLADFGVLSADWGMTPQQVTAVAPSATPVLWYAFDESGGNTAADSSGNGHTATATGFPAWDPSGGQIGGCINFDGFFSMAVPGASVATVSNEITVSLWVNGSDSLPAQTRLFHAADTSGATAADTLMVSLPWDDGDVIWGTTSVAADWTRWSAEKPSDFKGAWTHYAFTKDAVAGVLRIYRDGELVQETFGAVTPIDGAGVTDFAIGSLWNGSAQYHLGRLDDFRIYDVELSHGEVLDLAGISGSITVPVESAADTDVDGDVDLVDLSTLLGIWLTEVDWPM